jgi:carboxyl-terminal processing protease
MRRSLALCAVLAWAAPSIPAEPGSPPELAARAWAITDAVLARHVEPPARQQLLLAGIQAMNQAGRVPSPPGLARLVSSLETPAQLAEILAEPISRFVRSAEGPTPEDAFLDGLLRAVPGGAELLSARELKVAEQVEGNLYVGIQVALGTDDQKRPTFAQVLEGGPAEAAGAREGDRIEAVDGVSTEKMPLSEVVDRIRGEEGTEVVIRLGKKGINQAVDVPMKRSRLARKTVRGVSPLPGGRWVVRLDGPAPIGYLKLTEVVGSTPQELRSLAAQLEAEGARGLVLDLREVTHAGLHPTILLADALLEGGTIGRIREDGAERVIRAEPDALFRGWPIVVLAGGGPVEVDWLCAALEDNRRATILGRPASRPGGDLVRAAVPLPGGEWSIKMATGRLERGDGRPLVAALAGPRERMEGLLTRADAIRNKEPGVPLARARALLEAALKPPGS